MVDEKEVCYLEHIGKVDDFSDDVEDSVEDNYSKQVYKEPSTSL